MSKLPDINQQFPEWYQEVIYQAELADQAPVRGCMVVRPYGTALWENIQSTLDKRIKETGHQNALFPLFIPESFLKKEADHVEGFSPELAVVTHAGGEELEEPLVVRPTSETIIHYMFSQWLKSYRDLPLKVNQWCSVVRWEKRARPFLRTTEFFWHEGHTAHETEQEAREEVLLMLQEFVNLAQNYLAIPVVPGRKSKGEQFPGADETYTFEGLMQDGKALQMGTSHLISRSFARAFNMQYQDREGKLEHPYLTSWCGATTRLIGALIMVHGDQKGLVMPPKIAPIQVVIIPILKGGDENRIVLEKARELAANLKPIAKVHLDDNEQDTPGAKFFKWELRGIPVRIELGPRDVASGNVVVVDRLGSGKKIVPMAELESLLPQMFDSIQDQMFKKAEAKRVSQWFKDKDTIEQVGKIIDERPGFYQLGWCQGPACEAAVKEYKTTIRVLLQETTKPNCFKCGKPSLTDVLVAKSY
jgi:prolyl-tRNA synthetase